MATVTQIDVSRQLLGSSLKVEFVELTAVTNGDTFVSKLQNPLAAFAFNDGDAAGANGISAAVSGKTVTIHDPDITTVGVLVFGF